MNRWGPLVLVVVLLLGFALVANSIIGVKLLELRVKISRERILNYELSSRVLKEKFLYLMQSEKQGFDSEIRQNILESSIMNDKDPEALSLTLSEQIGYWIINMIRPLALKPFLQLLADQEQLILMKYAFFMERNRRYNKAIEKYEQLAAMLPADNGDARGFVLLHLGYCMAVGGQTSNAIQKLEMVENDFAGSHYAQTARVLLELLEEAQKASAEIKSQELTDLQKARRLFAISQFKPAINLFEKEQSLIPMDQYRLARSKEEMGQVKIAIQEYLQIVKQNQDMQAVRAANRRLLLIGSFYGGGNEVKKVAEQKARDIGDSTAVQKVQTAAASQRKSIILDEIRQGTKGGKSTDPMLQELGKEIETSIELEEKLIKNDERDVVRIKKPENLALNKKQPSQSVAAIQTPSINEFLAKNDALEALPEVEDTARLFANTQFQIQLKDERLLQGNQILFKETEVQILRNDFQMAIPQELLDTIFFDKQSTGASVFSILTLSDGEHLKITRMEILKQKEVKVFTHSGQEQIFEYDEIEKLLVP